MQVWPPSGWNWSVFPSSQGSLAPSAGSSSEGRHQSRRSGELYFSVLLRSMYTEYFGNCYFQITVWDNVDLCYMNISDIPTFIEQSNCQRVLAEIVRSRRSGIIFIFRKKLTICSPAPATRMRCQGGGSCRCCRWPVPTQPRPAGDSPGLPHLNLGRWAGYR